MKRFVAWVIAGLALLVVQAEAKPTIYFSDTFDRADNTDLNASSGGKAGTLGALTWSSKLFGSGGTRYIQIQNNSLRIRESTSGGGGIVWPDHNFTEPEGEFWVSTVIGATASGGDGRTAGFGMGQTLADLTNSAHAWPSQAGAPNSDFYVRYDNIGAGKAIVIYENKASVKTIPLVASLPDTLSARFTFDSMSAGSNFSYEVFLDGATIYTGTNSWSGTDENYISLSANTTLDTRFNRFIVSDGLVLFNDDAESFETVDVAPRAGTYAEYSYASTTMLRDDGTATPFGTNNQFIELSDAVTSAGVRFISQDFPEAYATLSTFSFDFFETSTGGTAGGMVVGYSRAGLYNLSTTTHRLRITLRNGAIAGLSSGSGSYDLDAAYRLYIILNDSVGAIDYGYGTVAPETADIWLQKLDGSAPAFVGTRVTGNAPTSGGYSVGLVSWTSSLEEIYVDNMAVSPGAFLEFPTADKGTLVVIK